MNNVQAEIEKEILFYKNNENINVDKYIFKGIYKEDIERVANDMLKDKYFIPSYGYTDNLFSIVSNRSILRLVHGFVFSWSLIYAFRRTKDNKYLKKLISIIDNWINNIKDYEAMKSIVFHDETTALRLTQFICVFNECIKILEIDSIKNLYREIKYTAKLLSEDIFYSKNTNHGMFQDRALIIYSMYFINDEKSAEYYQIAKSRLILYMEYIYTKSGVHKEHSPAYHFLVTEKIVEIAKEVEKIDNEFNRYINNIYLNSCKFSSYIMKPDGTLPNVGDTQPNIDAIKYYKNMYDDENYKNIINKRYEDISLDTDFIDAEAGYAILRNKWGEDAIYVLFLAAYHTDYHKHCDDLSFIVYFEGDIISESGPYGYSYKEEYCKHGYSSFAHNTLLVNGKSIPRIDSKYNKVKITESKKELNITKVKGINERYEGVKHERIIIFEKNKSVIKIDDHITSDEFKDYTLLFHLAPNLVPKQINDKIEIYKDDKLVCELVFSCENCFETSCFYGDSKEDIKGLNFPEMYRTDMNYVLYVNINSVNSVNINTVLTIK